MNKKRYFIAFMSLGIAFFAYNKIKKKLTKKKKNKNVILTVYKDTEKNYLENSSTPVEIFDNLNSSNKKTGKKYIWNMLQKKIDEKKKEGKIEAPSGKKIKESLAFRIACLEYKTSGLVWKYKEEELLKDFYNN